MGTKKQTREQQKKQQPKADLAGDARPATLVADPAIEVLKPRRVPLMGLWRGVAQWLAVTLSLYSFPGAMFLTMVLIGWALLLAVWIALDVTGVSILASHAMGISEHGVHEVVSVALDACLFQVGEVLFVGRGAELVSWVQHAVDPERGDKRAFFVMASVVYVSLAGLYFLHVATDKRWKRAAFRRTDVLRKTTWFAKLFRGYFTAETYADVATSKGTHHLSFTRLDGAPGAPDTERAIQAAFATFPACRAAAEMKGDSDTVTFNDTEDEPARYLFCAHPHGLFSFSVWCTFNCWTRFYERLFDKRGFITTVHTLAANFRFAVWREILLDFRFSDVAPTTLHHALGGVEATHCRTRARSRGAKAARGRKSEATPTAPTLSRPAVPKQHKRAAALPRVSLLVPGGAEESVNCTEPRLTLAKRKGFVRIALQTGASLVPMYTFGETELYRPVTKHPLVIRALMKLEKMTGIGTPLVIGHDVFNIFTPKRRKLRTVFGKPIDVRKYWRAMPPSEVADAVGSTELGKKPGPYFTDADVERLHGEYVAALEALFTKYRPRLDPDGPAALSFDQV
jgi:hypothetical protein